MIIMIFEGQEKGRGQREREATECGVTEEKKRKFRKQ